MVPVGGSAIWVLGVLWSLGAVTLGFVLLRLYTRLKVVDAYGLDDHFFNAAFAMLIIYCITITVASHYGFGQELQALSSSQDVTTAILWEAVGQTIVVLAVWVSKTSLALFLLRLVSSRRQKVAVMIPCAALGIAVMLSLIIWWLGCRPLAFLWDHTIPGGYCSEAGGYVSIVAGYISVITDLWYAAFPWYMLWNVRMPSREKLVIQISLSLGIIAAGCGVERALQLKTLGSQEYLRDTAPLIVWHAAELFTTMICIGIPVCRPLYQGWIDRVTRRMRSEDRVGEIEADGVFTMHTIGGSTFKQNKRSPEDDNRSEIVLRHDLPQGSPNQTVIKSVRHSPSGNTSQESILGDEPTHSSRRARRPSTDDGEFQETNAAGISITTTFGIELESGR